MKKPKITILDLGYGNFKSLINAFDYLNIKTYVTNNKKKISSSDMLCLPGVGAYKTGIDSLKDQGLFDVLREVVNIKKRKVLGICLGMQLLCSSSEEGNIREGLNFLNLKITKFKSKNLKIPHIGFNSVKNHNFSLLKNVKKNYFYFAHSYAAKKKPLKGINFIECEYGEKFIAGFEKNNVYGLQFHPEKSQSNGLKILENFYKI